MPTTEVVDVLIVGGGIAGASAAAELRRLGFDGSILLATRESDEPYERPMVTKQLLQGAGRLDGISIRPSAWWGENTIELRTRTPVASLEIESRTVIFGDKKSVRFRYALLATGAMVRRLQVEGSRLAGIHYLRVPGNAVALRNELEDRDDVAVIGGSYIACEVAASLAKLGKHCTMIMQEQHPLERGFGSTVGAWVGEILREHDIELLTDSTVAQFDGTERVEAVVTAEGRRVAADAVVVGVGAVPDVAIARKAGMAIGDTGGVVCDACLQTSVLGVYAAGDMCEYESVLHGRNVRIEHYEHAAAQGRTVARNIAGHTSRHEDVPYFWTELADWITLEHVGISSTWDSEEIEGSLASMSFVVRYQQQGNPVAALVCSRPSGLEAAMTEIASVSARGWTAR